MDRSRYHVPYSKSILEFTLPSTMRATVAVSQPAEPLKDVLHAIHEALAHPVGTRPLCELARPGNRVCIVFTDITRASPDHLLVTALLGELEKAGVRDEDITLLCGTGMDARGLDDAALLTGARRSTMDELAVATAEADKMLVF